MRRKRVKIDAFDRAVAEMFCSQLPSMIQFLEYLKKEDKDLTVDSLVARVERRISFAENWINRVRKAIKP